MRKSNNIKTSLRKKIIRFTTMAIIFSLLFCISIFYVTTYNILSKYIINDIEFFLKETTEHLDNKTILVEDVLLRIRDNSVISTYLNNTSQNLEVKASYNSISENLNKCVDIYSNQNSDYLEKPFVESVYLFSNKGDFFRSLYNDKIKQDIFKIDYKYQKLYEKFNNKNEDVQFFKDKDQYIIAYTVYSKYMDNIGIAFFSININSIKQIMNTMNKYENTYWCVIDKNNNLVVSNNNLDVYRTDLLKIDNVDNNIFEKDINNNQYMMYSKKLSMGLKCIGGVPQNIIHKLMIESITYPIIILIIISILLITMFGFVIYNLTKPLKEVTDKIRNVGEGNFDEKLPEYNSLEFSEISHVFNKMTEKINYLIKDVYQKKIMIMEKDFKFLQSQMNPHFMFNVLNTIAFKAQMNGNYDIYKMINSFANLLQATIYRKGDEKITIKEELKYVNYYLYLQESRFGDKLKYNINYSDENLLNYYIPKLTIQVMVENAVVHGIEKKIDSGKVNVNIKSYENDIIIEVIDDGYGFDGYEGKIIPPINIKCENKKHNGIGINNTQGIIQYFYGKQYGITIVTNKENGTKVKIKIPFDNGGKYV